MGNELKYQVLLYYKFVQIDEPENFAVEHLHFCKQLGLKGRILVAAEGINGTVSGTVEETQSYMNAVHADPRFADMVFKVDSAEGHVFKKMKVKLRREIITLRDPEVDPTAETGQYLEPEDFYNYLQRDDVLVIDGRNDAIRPDVKAFREFPQWIRDNLQDYKDRKVIMYCTGGIRCEKLSGVFLKEGFHDVAQLHGGIVTYSKDPGVQGRLFDGKCYVFDERISVRINQTDEDVVVGTCHHCQQAADRYINCNYSLCHKQHICCESCEAEHHGYCSSACQEQDAALAGL
jgi:UPF0176 protein